MAELSTSVDNQTPRSGSCWQVLVPELWAQVFEYLSPLALGNVGAACYELHNSCFYFRRGLNFSDCNLNTTTVESIFTRCNTELKMLNIAGCERNLADRVMSKILDFSHLHTLDISSSYCISNKSIKEICKLENLTSLNMSRCFRLGNGCLPDLAKMTQLETLLMDHVRIDSLRPLESLVNLKKLAYGAKIVDEAIEAYLPFVGLTEVVMPVPKGKPIEKVLENVKNLTRLTIKSFLPIDEGARVPHHEDKPFVLNDLKEFELIGNTCLFDLTKVPNITKFSLSKIRQISNIVNWDKLTLTELHFSDTTLPDLKQLAVWMMTIQVLEISNCNLTDEEKEHLAQFDVEHLDLHRTNFHLSDLKYLKNSKRLKGLNVSGTTAAVDGDISFLNEIKTLQELDVSYGAILPSQLTQIASCQNITNLNVSCNRLEDTNVKLLLPMKTLIRLNLSFNQNITHVGVNYIAELPSLCSVNVFLTGVNNVSKLSPTLEYCCVENGKEWL